MKSERWLGPGDLFGVFLVLGLGWSRGSLAGDPGLGWHLRIGQWIVENWRIPRVDPFLVDTVAGQTQGAQSGGAGLRWVHDQWLSDVVLHLLYSAGSWPLIHVATVFTIAACFVCGLSPLLDRMGTRPVVHLAVVMLVATVGAVQFFTRPVIFSFLLFVLLYRFLVEELILTTSPSRRYLYYFLPLLFFIWSNLHPAFPLGFLLIGVFALSSILDKDAGAAHARAVRLFWLLPLCIAATFLNPSGPMLYKQIGALVGDSYFMSLNQEWLSITFTHPQFVPVLLVLLLVMALSARCRSLTLADAALLLLFLLLSLLHRRYLPFLCFVLARPLALMFSTYLPARMRAGRPRSSAGVATLCSLIALTVAAFSWASDDKRLGFNAQPVVALLEKLEAEDARGLVFHSPDWGGLFSFYRFPQQKTYIDDRNNLNEQWRYEQYFRVRAGKREWEQVLEDENVSWLLLDKYAPLRWLVGHNDDWQLAVTHQDVMLYRKTDT